MLKSMTGLKASVVVLVTLAIPFLAQAQANRTWVSGVGDDANFCSRTTPCKTLAGALVKTNMGGEINCLTPGGYGQVNISKSVTIDGTGCNAGILALAGNGILINLTAQNDVARTVRLRGLTINGLRTGTNGIKVVTAKRVFIENVVIDGFADHGIQLQTTQSTNIYVKDSTIRNAGKSGINSEPSGNILDATLWVDRTALLDNLAGVFLGKGTRASIRDSSILRHKQGLLAEKAEATLVNCLLSENVTALDARIDSTIRISNVTVVNNGNGLVISNNGKIISFKNNVIHGNQQNGAPTESLSTL